MKDSSQPKYQPPYQPANIDYIVMVGRTFCQLGLANEISLEQL